MHENSPTHYMFAEPEKFNFQELLRAVKEHKEWEEPDFNPDRSWIVIQHKSCKMMNKIAKAKCFHIPHIPYLYQSGISKTERVALGWMKATSQPPCRPWSRPSPVATTGKKSSCPTPMPFKKKKQWQETKHHRHPSSSPYLNGSSGCPSPPLVVSPPEPLNKRVRLRSRREALSRSSANCVPFGCVRAPISYRSHRMKQ